MQDRYVKIATLPKNLYSSGAPLLIVAGALLYDRVQSKNLVQLKFQNLSSSNIRSATVELSLIDNKSNVTQTISHQYVDFSFNDENEFGSKEPIYLSSRNVASFTVKITEVTFSGGKVWQNKESSWNPLKQQPLLSFETPELEDHFRVHFGQQCKYAFMKQKDLWHCPCGKINKGDQCASCGLSLKLLNDFDITSLKTSYKEHFEKRRKRSSIMKTTAIAMIPIALFLCYLFVHIIPTNKYEKALKLMDEENYVKAVELLEQLDNFSDSPVLLKKAKGELAEFEKYNLALSLFEEEEYYDAEKVFEELGDFKDSKNYFNYIGAISMEMYEAESLYKSLPADFLDVKEVLSFLDAHRKWAEKIYYCHKYDDDASEDNWAKLGFYKNGDSVIINLNTGHNKIDRNGQFCKINGTFGWNGLYLDKRISLTDTLPEKGFLIDDAHSVTLSTVILENYYHYENDKRVFSCE